MTDRAMTSPPKTTAESTSTNANNSDIACACCETGWKSGIGPQPGLQEAVQCRARTSTPARSSHCAAHSTGDRRRRLCLLHPDVPAAIASIQLARRGSGAYRRRMRNCELGTSAAAGWRLRGHWIGALLSAVVASPLPAQMLAPVHTDSVAIEEARADSARRPYTAADVAFVSGMIHH